MIDRSDTLRASYSQRASLILSADAIVLGTIVIIVDKYLSKGTDVLKYCVIVSLVLMVGSFVLAFRAAANFRRSRKSTKYTGPKRLFLNPSESAQGCASYKKFAERFSSLASHEFLDIATGELWVAHRLQVTRYSSLKTSMSLLFGAFLALIVALVIILLSNH